MHKDWYLYAAIDYFINSLHEQSELSLEWEVRAMWEALFEWVWED